MKLDDMNYLRLTCISSAKKISTSFEDRNRSEKRFFSRGKYRDLDPDMVGIQSLRTRLSQLLHNHLKKELPHLQRELDEKYQETVKKLQSLGEARATVKEQRRFLMAKSAQFQKVADAAVDGHYEDKFFGNVKPEASIDDPSNTRRLRAVVQHLNLQFAALMRRYGHKYKIGITEGNNDGFLQTDEKQIVDPELDSSYASAAWPQITKTRAEAISWVKNVLQRSRGRELPGNFNPLLINELFKEQSESWETLALAHIDRIAIVCESFVRALLNDVTTPDVSARLQAHQVEPALKARLAGAQAELSKIIQDKNRHPITYNHYYTTTIQKMRNKKRMNRINKLAKLASSNLIDANLVSKEHIDPKALQTVLEAAIEPDMDKISAEDALDSEMAYYKVSACQ